MLVPGKGVAHLEDGWVAGCNVVDANCRIGQEPGKKDGRVCEAYFGRSEALPSKYHEHDRAADSHHCPCIQQRLSPKKRCLKDPPLLLANFAFGVQSKPWQIVMCLTAGEGHRAE